MRKTCPKWLIIALLVLIACPILPSPLWADKGPQIDEYEEIDGDRDRAEIAASYEELDRKHQRHHIETLEEQNDMTSLDWLVDGDSTLS